MKNKRTITYIVFILVCQMAGIIGSLFTAPAVKGWYTTINKSPLNPPSWVFAPVWTTLFVMMGISVSIIWLSEKTKEDLKLSRYFLCNFY